MKKAVVMEKKVTPLKTEVVKIVKDPCPIDPENEEDFNLTLCLDCEYIIQEGKVVSHGWYEYKTSIIKERSEIEDEDVDITDYYRTIPCASCGSDTQFHSSYSGFVKGDKEKCPECGLLHTYLRDEKRGEGFVGVFAIPIKDWEEKQQ